MNSYWVGVIIGAGFSSVFFAILMLINIQQNTEMKNQIRSEIQDVRELVGEHEKIMRAYEFYNWKMSFSEEEKNEMDSGRQ